LSQPWLDALPPQVRAPLYLADTSALVRMRLPPVASSLGPLIQQGLVARCGPIDLEMLWTARNTTEVAQIRAERTLAFPLLPVTQQHYDRAMDVMGLLAAANKHRAARIPDLVIAAVAESAEVILIHYDADFDHIASVTSQRTQWVAPRGSLEPGSTATALE
jgi:predicted nucleic acid-binding protein